MHLFPFRNEYRDRDFKLILDAVNEYFPTGKGKRLDSKTYPTSPRFEKLEKIVRREFLDKKAYGENWGKLVARLKRAFKKPVSGYPDLGSCGFVGEVVLEEKKQPDFIRQKTLRFYVSTIGPFFSIQGVDSSIVILEIESGMSDPYNKGKFAAIHAITVSPVFEYQEAFSMLEEELRKHFAEYLFVPYKIGMSTINNISFADEQQDSHIMDTIYEALFGRTAVHDRFARGDQYYGMNDWLKPLDKKERSLIDLVSKNIVNPSADTTVHKVWKLQESKRLDTFKISGNLMFGMDLFDVIDLTDKSKAILVLEKRGTPSILKYKIKNDLIELDPGYLLRIVDLSSEGLTVNMVMNFKSDGVSIKGETMQMKFIQMKKVEPKERNER